VSVSFVALSLAIVLYPTQYRLEYTPVQSLDAISNLWLFMVLLFLWMAALLLLLWRITSPRSAAFLVACFGVVYFGFWTVHWPYGAFEDWLNLQSAQVVILTGHVQPAVEHYWNWPGLAFLGASYSDVTGLQLPSVLPVLIPIAEVLLCLLLFEFYRRVLGDLRLAIVAVIVAIVGNLYLLRFHFHPHDFALVLLFTFLLLNVLNLTAKGNHTSFLVTMLVTIGSLVVTHLVTSVLAMIMLLTMVILRKFGVRELSQMRRLSLVVITAVLIVGWQLFWAFPIFQSSVNRISLALQNALQGELSSLSYASMLASENTVGYPIWANVTRWGLVLVVYLLGTIYALWGIHWRSHASLQMKITSSWVVAAAALTGLLTLLIAGGEEIRRFIFYGSLLTSPVLVYWFFRRLNRRSAQIFLSILLLVSIVPSFLSTSNLVSTSSYYKEDQSAGQFLQNFTGNSTQVELHGIGAGVGVGSFYLPLADKQPGLLLDVSGGASNQSLESYATSRYGLLASRFVSSSSDSFFWTDQGFEAYLQQWFGKDAALSLVNSQPARGLLDSTARVYDNGMVVLLRN